MKDHCFGKKQTKLNESKQDTLSYLERISGV